LVPPLAMACFLLVAYSAGRQVATGPSFRLVLLSMAVVGIFILLNPSLGLYLFLFTSVLVPFDWRLSRLSPSSIVIGAAVAALGVLLAARRVRLSISILYPLAGLAVLVAWVNFVRYGPVSGCAVCGFNVPYVLSEALLLSVLARHLVQTRRQLHRIMVVLTLAFIVRNLVDVGMTMLSIHAGNPLGLIRTDRLWLKVTSTVETDWRVLLLPLFLAGTLMAPRGAGRALFGLAALLDVAWLALAGTRTGLVALGLVPLFTLVLLPSAGRSGLLRLMPLIVALVVLLAGVFSGLWTHMVSRSEVELGALWQEGRTAAWRDAFDGFLRNPLWGSSPGPSHSYILGTARYMGLAFLVPFGAALWTIWRHGAWLRGQPLDHACRIVVTGVQAGLLIAIVLNISGTMFQGATAAFFFWLLAGVQEAIYQDARSGRRAMAGTPVPEESSAAWRIGGPAVQPQP
jgi:hypothetical protein